ncbi:MFS transporter [Amycolatopsis sp. FDAARGOS 1241]|uniref:MFS transporter n=1 Tax=Amycolatopsis sp. FDAARGOS 1241 TaxID=2778070 RepID=UPI0019520A8C|nr:MFS transporter [Amycolatopsis sp. FDAARGOS 1241]QRP43477.1 MHS family MFS transporter [Amycolatopsis sp. FDAARGOS 1241]
MNGRPDRAGPAAGRPAKAALAAWIGSALEYYDFFIYGTAAALVFGKIFFPSSSPAAGTLLALSTFGVGYVTRPLGALLLGHLGDRFGRKRVLIATLLLMGLSTVLVGCLPSYAAMGVASPILLVALRLLQGLSAGGEQASANSMSLEHAPENRRAYYTSFTLSGTQAGQIVATAVFLPVAALPQDALLSWGWRVPFWLSAVMVAVGYFIRRSVEETPVFREEVAAGEVVRLPLAVLLRDHWTDVLRVIVAALIASVSTIFTVYALSYAVNTVGLSKTPMLWVGVLANVAAVISIPLWAKLSDRTGRKRIFIAGSLGCAVLIFGYLGAIAAGSYVWIFVLGIGMFGIVYTATSAIWPSFYGEMFPARVRLSGTAIGTQIGFAISGFLPSVAAAVAGDGKGAWLGVAIFTAGLCVVNAIAVATGRETYRVPTALLGLKQQPARQPQGSEVGVQP